MNEPVNPRSARIRKDNKQLNGRRELTGYRQSTHLDADLKLGDVAGLLGRRCRQIASNDFKANQGKRKRWRTAQTRRSRLDTSLPVRRMAAAATAAARQISCRLFPISLPPAALLHSRWNLLPRFLVPVRLFLTSQCRRPYVLGRNCFSVGPWPRRIVRPISRCGWSRPLSCWACPHFEWPANFSMACETATLEWIMDG